MKARIQIALFVTLAAASGSAAQTPEPSDLDRPLDELFAAACEHEVPTHQCDECRYEVGVVKAPSSLFAEGLLKTAVAERRALQVPLPLTGEVNFDERRVVHVDLQSEGTIREVHVTRGDRVRRGQPLITIASAAAGEALAAHREAQGMLDLARRSHDRQTALRQEGISAEKELLQAERDLDAARIRADAALGALVRLGMDDQSIRSLGRAGRQDEIVLRASADGTVVELHAVPGEVAGPGETLATLGDASSLWVWADIYERDLAAVATAQARSPLAAVVTVAAFPGEEFPGIVDYLSPTLDTFSRTAKLRVAVANPAGRLLAGMFAGVDVQMPGLGQALVLPRDAVLEDEGRSFVFMHHHDDYYVRRPVTPGRVFAGWIEIADGLAGHETIVTDGAFLLKSDVLRSKMGAGCAD